MTTQKFDITGEIKLSFDRNSKDFKEALSAFNETIQKNGNEYDMLRHVAFYVTRFGTYGMVEGVGYVGQDKHKSKEKPFSGIYVMNGYDEFEFD